MSSGPAVEKSGDHGEGALPVRQVEEEMGGYFRGCLGDRCSLDHTTLREPPQLILQHQMVDNSTINTSQTM